MRPRPTMAAMAGFVLAVAACTRVATEPPRLGAAEGDPVDIVATRSQPRGTLVIHATGDVSLDPSQIRTFRTHGYGWAWSGLDDLFRNDDLTLVNLECPATDVVEPVSKAFTIRCDPDALPEARDAGVDVVSQANNHAFDEGPSGLVDSLSAIRSAGLVPVGAGADREEALRAAIFQTDGWRVAILGVDQVVDPPEEVAGTDEPGTAVGHDFAMAIRAVREAAASSDLVMVMIHWGIELDAHPRAVPGEAGASPDRRGRRRHPRSARAQAPAHGDLPRPTDLLLPGQLRVAPPDPRATDHRGSRDHRGFQRNVSGAATPRRDRVARSSRTGSRQPSGRWSYLDATYRSSRIHRPARGPEPRLDEDARRTRCSRSRRRGRAGHDRSARTPSVRTRSRTPPARRPKPSRGQRKESGGCDSSAEGLIRRLGRRTRPNAGAEPR